MSREEFLPKVNDRIECLGLNESVRNTDPDQVALLKGDKGTVLSVRHIDNFWNNGEGFHQIIVKWDHTEAKIPLIAEQDQWRIIN